MARYLDIASWSRRDLFEFFLPYQTPYFNICTHLDVTKLLTRLRVLPQINVTLTYHYVALRAANDVEPFRYRLRDGRVIVYDVIHGGTTVLLPNESFSFAYFDYTKDFNTFITAATKSLTEVQRGNSDFSPDNSDDRIHFTVLPWVSFTSFAHARTPGPQDSVPKIAFGKFVHDGDRTLLPTSVEVHHALMDGLHVGRFIARMEELLQRPEDYLPKV